MAMGVLDGENRVLEGNVKVLLERIKQKSVCQVLEQ